MKNLKLFVLVIFVVFATVAYADDNSINGTCPGEIIEELDSASTSATHTENGGIAGIGNDRYRMTFPVAGTLSINISNRDASRNANYDFYVSNTSCGNWNIVNAQRGRSHTANVTVNAGDTIWVRMQAIAGEPNNGRHSYALALAFTTTSAPPVPTRDFTQRYTNNLKGNLKVIGNTVLQSLDGYSLHNNRVRLQYVDVDSDGSTFNSSSATINVTEAGVDISGARIKWAGLYWQGYLHNDNLDPGIDSQYNISSTQATAHTQIQNIISSHSVSLQTGTNPAYNVAPDQVNWHIQYDFNNYVAYKYGAFADITSLLQDQSPSVEYTIANIPTREGRTNSGIMYDGLGNYGAWSLVIVYDNNTSLAEKTRNISVFGSRYNTTNRHSGKWLQDTKKCTQWCGLDLVSICCRRRYIYFW